MFVGIVIGLFLGWISMIGCSIVVGRALVKHPPEAAIRFISKQMGKQMVKGIVKSR